MRITFRLLLCITFVALLSAHALALGKITMDPNAGPAAAKSDVKPDPRVEQKVTYEAGHKAVQDIIADLSVMTGITIKAGRTPSDWPVRARRMNIFVKDVRLADLMNSIAHVMKFAWSRNDDVNPPTYRLVVDGKAALAADAKKAAAQKKREEMWRKRREAWLEVIMRDGTKSEAEIDAVRDTDPAFYREAKPGGIRAIRALFDELPEAKQRFVDGRSFRVSVDKLSQKTRGLQFTAGDKFIRFLQGGRGETPKGFENTFSPGDKIDVAWARLDDCDTFTPNKRWGIHTIGAVGYLHFSKGERDWGITGFKDKDAEWMPVYCARENDIIDGLGTFRSTMDRLEAMAPSMEDYVRKCEQSLYPPEPLNDHSAVTGLEKTITIKVEIPKSEPNPAMDNCVYVGSFEKVLAETSGFGVVSDSWVNNEGEKLTTEESKLGEILEQFSSRFGYNWDKNSNILEFRHRLWWKNRLNQIPQGWIEAWGENTLKNGILSLDDLAQISALTYDQAEESLKPDKILGTAGLYRDILRILDTNGNLHWLRLYSSLSPALRALIAGEYGINGHMLTSDQWKLAQTMFDRIGSGRGDAVFRLEIDADKRKITYRFREVDGESGAEDRYWEVRLMRLQPLTNAK